jgi:DNA-binding response OmpR family regulator
MTAIDDEATRQEALDVGCVTYLKKPFLAKLLIDAINAAA